MTSLEDSNFFRPTRAVIDLSALRHNVRLALQLAGPRLRVLGVVKANAYGHGAIEVSRVLLEEGVEVLGVATPVEALQLRAADVRCPVLLLGGPFSVPGDLLRVQALTPVVFNLEQCAHLQKTLSAPLGIQLKVDTGMHRLGILPSEIPLFLSKLKEFSNLKLEGILTHLAQADSTFSGPTADQIECFAQTESQVREFFPQVSIFHLANSAALLGGHWGPCQWVRPGILLYGSYPHPRFQERHFLRPVMHFKTRIFSLKEIAVGEAVSYGGDWVAQRPSRIAVLPVGYADGYPRHLSFPQGQVLIRGQRFPVAGRVCMDLTMVDVTDLPQVELGEEVTLWGPGLPAETVAAWAGTISYELFCGVAARVPREYCEERAGA